METANVVRGLMAEHGKTVPWLAEQIGLGRATLSQKLNGYTQFNMDEIEAIAGVFHISLVELMERKERLEKTA